MSERTMLLSLLHSYAPDDAGQQAMKQQLIEFVSNNPDCFSRSNLAGHITGSCWLTDISGQEVLLTHHKKIGGWLQLGGHADGDADILRVALREACEESGIAGIVAASPDIFDVDVHRIAEFSGVPEHFHYDVRFSLRAPHKQYDISEESHALAWFSIEALAEDPNTNESLRRMARKWQATMKISA